MTEMLTREWNQPRGSQAGQRVDWKIQVRQSARNRPEQEPRSLGRSGNLLWGRRGSRVLDLVKCSCKRRLGEVLFWVHRQLFFWTKAVTESWMFSPGLGAAEQALTPSGSAWFGSQSCTGSPCFTSERRWVVSQDSVGDGGSGAGTLAASLGVKYTAGLPPFLPGRENSLE